MIPVEVVIPNSQGKIGSGLLARVNFETQTQQRVVVPQTAIQKQAGAAKGAGAAKIAGGEQENPSGTLFVVKDTEGKAKVVARAVTLGKRVDGRVEILSGLQAGERYVVRSGQPLKDGAAVRLSILSETAESSPKGN
ncbi:hypothetical protein ANSO36C_36680 [Nostoc cf. commune SO-36]|uniref:CzcB-like C-terminal circularly permuted SH3-like domain-containing protein n=1 Tax=Nostoc cf. commune SO-36 TaxID=449208 RepID=A0ABN6Q3W8_NOSCO|nr:hypothetical protein ANSO36C_36680 [Nostoc cf. commune SO-36]